MRLTSLYFQLTPAERCGLYSLHPTLAPIEASWYGRGSVVFQQVAADGWWLAPPGYSFCPDLPPGLTASLRVPARQLADAAFAARSQRVRVADAALLFLAQVAPLPKLALICIESHHSPLHRLVPAHEVARLLPAIYPEPLESRLKELTDEIDEWLPAVFPTWLADHFILELLRWQSPPMRPAKPPLKPEGAPPGGDVK